MGVLDPRSTVHLGAYQLTKHWKMFIRKNWNRISTDRQLRRTCLKPDFLQNDFNVQCWSDDLKWKLLGTKTYLNSVTDSQIREIYYMRLGSSVTRLGDYLATWANMFGKRRPKFSKILGHFWNDTTFCH